MKLIALKGVSVRFGKVNALSEVDFELNQGDITLLAGPNGAGKTTILRVLLGLVRPDVGAMLLDGIPHLVDRQFKTQIGYLPEAVAFSESLSGQQVMRFIASARGVSRARVQEVLQMVGLSAAAGRAIRGYSRGMRQRLGLGVAILSEPELLILDEPTGGLDQQGLELLWEVLKTWKAARRMVLLSSHDLTLLEQRVDRICLLKEGKVKAIGTPMELRELARAPVTVTMTLSDDQASVQALISALRTWRGELHLNVEDSILKVEIQPEALLALMDIRAQHLTAVNGIRVAEPAFDIIYEHLLRGGPSHGTSGTGAGLA